MCVYSAVVLVAEGPCGFGRGVGQVCWHVGSDSCRGCVCLFMHPCLRSSCIHLPHFVPLICTHPTTTTLTQASDHGSNSLGHLISLFVERSHQLWKAGDVLQWLQVAATAAADVADGVPRKQHPNQQHQQHPNRTPPSAMTPDDVVVEGTAEDWACVAKESFPAAGRNEYGHLRLADFSDAVNALPQEEMQAMMQAPAAGGAGGGMPGAGVSSAACAWLSHVWKWLSWWWWFNNGRKVIAAGSFS